VCYALTRHWWKFLFTESQRCSTRWSTRTSSENVLRIVGLLLEAVLSPRPQAYSPMPAAISPQNLGCLDETLVPFTVAPSAGTWYVPPKPAGEWSYLAEATERSGPALCSPQWGPASMALNRHYFQMPPTVTVDELSCLSETPYSVRINWTAVGPCQL